MNVTTKDKMLDAAVRLFHTQGYDGTSVRDIATKANVNIAMISYHFGGKQGLYEELITKFLEGYLQTMKGEVMREKDSTMERLLSLLKSLLTYQSRNHFVARMVHREMTFDSTVVRELMSTYSRKEKHYYEGFISLGMKTGEFQVQPIDYVIIHLRTLMTMPYLTPHYLQELFQVIPSESYFIERYMEHIERWIRLSLCQQHVTKTATYLYPPRSIS